MVEQEVEEQKEEPQIPEDIPEPMKQLMEWVKTTNNNLKDIANTVNQHSEAIKMIAERLNQSSPSQAPQGNGQDSDLMNNLMGLGQMFMQRNQANPMGEVFNQWLSGMINAQVNNMNASAELNRSISAAVTNAFSNKIANNVGEKITKVMMSE